MRLRKECEHGRYDAHSPKQMSAGTHCPGGEFLPEGALHEITLEADHEIRNNRGESMGIGCYPRGAVVGGDGECAEFALPPGRYLLVALNALASQVGESE